jgi:hypothetical protein
MGVDVQRRIWQRIIGSDAKLLMPLLDHFHPPLSAVRHWEAFHTAWASAIMRHLNTDVLPSECFAEAQVHIGSRVEIDVATFESRGAPRHESGNGAVALATWSPPAATMTMPTVFPDEIEIQVFRTTGGATLVGAIELISPGNKDRVETRRAFAAKCAAHIQMGVGVVIVDVVTERRANLHDEIVHLCGQPEGFRFPGSASLYAAAYRPARSAENDQIEIWTSELAVGQSLPTMPLALRGIGIYPLDLDGTYRSACVDSRL